jgi:hypothetical protein
MVELGEAEVVAPAVDVISSQNEFVGLEVASLTTEVQVAAVPMVGGMTQGKEPVSCCVLWRWMVHDDVHYSWISCHRQRHVLHALHLILQGDAHGHDPSPGSLRLAGYPCAC